MTEYCKALAQKNIGVLGLGVSGFACAEFLLNNNIQPFLVDGDLAGSGAVKARKQWPDIAIYDFAACQEKLNTADMLIISPGIALSHPALVEASSNEVEIIGDVELFARLNNAPVIAITGSNGKSSVTTLATMMLERSGFNAAYGGNIGVPVMALLPQANEKPLDVIVLELSSFQLETTDSLQCQSATILNVVEDHMDRYDDFEAYVAAKQKIYRHCKHAVINRNDSNTIPAKTIAESVTFGLDEPSQGEVGTNEGYIVTNVNGQQEQLCALDDLKLQGQHNEQNALAAWALVMPFAPSKQGLIAALTEFAGLPHRCQKVAVDGDIEWINDSKGTNVGATVAAIESVRPRITGRMALIAGGDGKQADFSPLKDVMKSNVDFLITFGEDGDQLDALYIGQKVAVNQLSEAVSTAKAWAKAQDCVMFSPACASGSAFTNYIERGDTFVGLVKSVEGGGYGH